MLLIAVEYVLGSPQRQGTLQETFQALQNLQQQSNRPGSGSGNSPSDPNFGSSGNRRPSGSGSSNSNFDPFNGPGFGNGNGGSGGSNQQRPSSTNNQQGFDVFNGPGAQGSGNSWSGGSQRPSTTIRSPLNVVSNELTIPEWSCVQRCQAVSTYDPVCGSDDITYTNSAKFRCAQNCGRSE